MFDSLSDRLGGVFDRLRGRGALNEADVREAMREVRIALLEADVALPVVRRFIDEVTEAAVGQSVLRSVTPGQQVVKIVNDALVAMLERLGYEVTVAIERDIAQYTLFGATVRFERYPRLDDLVEVEGEPAQIERAIAALALPREGFTAERLPDFVRRYEARTGQRAALSHAELAGDVRWDVRNA